MVDIIKAMRAWPGYVCTNWTLDEACNRYTITLEPAADSLPVCSHCGAQCALVHETVWREVEEEAILGHFVTLRIKIRRVECLHCGHSANESIPWLKPYARITDRLKAHVEHRTEKETVQYVAQETGLGWNAVKQVDKARLEAAVGKFKWDGATRLMVDEFSIHKRHKYATVVFNPDTKRVLWVGKGRSRETLSKFFKLLTEEQRNQIKVVAMDMSTAFDLEVRAQCPNAAVSYDLFHILALYHREVLDRVRVDAANKFKDDPAKRRIVKGVRWLLMGCPEERTEDVKNKLSEALDLNEDLMKASLLGDSLRHLWHLGPEEKASDIFNNWVKQAIASKVKCLADFARRLKQFYRDGVLASVRLRIGTSMLEGVNNKIKVLKRQAYGFHDDEYFFLKIKYAFRGV